MECALCGRGEHTVDFKQFASAGAAAPDSKTAASTSAAPAAPAAPAAAVSDPPPALTKAISSLSATSARALVDRHVQNAAAGQQDEDGDDEDAWDG